MNPYLRRGREVEKREGKEWKGGRWGRRRDETRVE
jgi:hypothetical protein